MAGGANRREVIGVIRAPMRLWPYMVNLSGWGDNAPAQTGLAHMIIPCQNPFPQLLPSPAISALSIIAMLGLMPAPVACHTLMSITVATVAGSPTAGRSTWGLGLGRH